jgi:hypothetical protein
MYYKYPDHTNSLISNICSVKTLLKSSIMRKHLGPLEGRFYYFITSSYKLFLFFRGKIM